MGHLINPRAFRLASNNSWEDIWYVKNLYYSEYLHNVLNIRNFIYYFFTRKKFLKSGVCFSHLNLFKYNKQHIIKIYIYHIDMEKASYKFLNKVYKTYYKGFKNKKIKLSKTFFLTHNSDLFLFLFIYFNLFFKYSKNKLKCNKYFIKNMKHSYNLLSFFNDKAYRKFVGLNNNNKSNLYYNFLLKNYNKLDLNHYLNQLIYNKIDIDKIYVIKDNFILTYFFNYFMYICKKIDLKKYQNSWDLHSKWYSILNLLKVVKYIKFMDKANYSYNQFFLYLSSILYISEIFKKLDCKYNLRDIIYYYIYNWLGKIYFFPYFKVLSNLWSNMFFYFLNFNNLKFYYYFLSNRDITASFLSRYIGLKLRKNHYLFAIINPLRNELWKIAKKSRLKINSRNNRFKFILYKFKDKFKYNLYSIHKIFMSIYFMYYKNNFSLLFISIFELKHYLKNYFKFNKFDYFISLNKYLFLNIYYIIYFEMNKNKWDFNMSKMLSNGLKYLLLNIFNIFNNVIYFNIKIYNIYNTSLLFMSSIFIKFYIYYNYIKLIWYKYSSINKRNIRSRILNAFNNSLVGYKMAFYGRFSRKQKASSIWFTHGRVPLNTLNIHIDYSFFTIPLKNSAVSIKIWLYKNPMYNSYKHVLKI